MFSSRIISILATADLYSAPLRKAKAKGRAKAKAKAKAMVVNPMLELVDRSNIA